MKILAANGIIYIDIEAKGAIKLWGVIIMFVIDYAAKSDLRFWQRLDKHLPESELLRKIADKRCYILKEQNVPVGLMRYNLFWDMIPFVNLIILEQSARSKGYGRQAMTHWEAEMRSLGYQYAMTSTQADENAQFFYRKLGYKDTGCLILNIPALCQPTELFFIKEL